MIFDALLELLRIVFPKKLFGRINILLISLALGGFVFLMIFFIKKQSPTHRTPSSISTAEEVFTAGLHFSEQDMYESAETHFAAITQNHPQFHRMEETYFHWIQALFHLQRYQDTIVVGHEMKEKFPFSSSKWTAYALLIQGRAYEKMNQAKKAFETYKYVSDNFTDPDIQIEAQEFLQEYLNNQF